MTALDLDLVGADAERRGQQRDDRSVGPIFLWLGRDLIFKASPNHPTIWLRDDPGAAFTVRRAIVTVDRGEFESFCPVVAVSVRFETVA